jgi:hypothetical protein
MSTRLDTILAKIEWAEHHVGNLNLELASFFDAKPYEIVVEHDAQANQEIYKINIRAPIPRTIPLMVGDIVHNLRSAFDHLAFQLAGSKASDRTAYPIASTAQNFKAIKKAKIEGIAADALAHIEATQPYHSGYEGIWSLHELNNFDKHRLPVVVMIAQQMAGVKMPMPEFMNTLLPSFNVQAFDVGYQAEFTCAATFMKGGGKSHVSIQDGDVIATCSPISGLPHWVKMYPQIAFTCDVAFHEPAIVKGEAVLPFLAQLAQLAKGTIQTFAQFL